MSTKNILYNELYLREVNLRSYLGPRPLNYEQYWRIIPIKRKFALLEKCITDQINSFLKKELYDNSRV